MNQDFEHVYTMTAYYDGPRGGIADFDGRPHAYNSLFDDIQDEWANTFILMPIDEVTLALALEDWQIWRRWETAFHEGHASHDTHPALPEDRSRHEDLKRELGTRLNIKADVAIKARAEFRTGPDETEAYGLEVRWTQINSNHGAQPAAAMKPGVK
jgi:hypothetical protein